jgi:hypothetical protein
MGEPLPVDQPVGAERFIASSWPPTVPSRRGRRERGRPELASPRRLFWLSTLDSEACPTRLRYRDWLSGALADYDAAGGPAAVSLGCDDHRWRQQPMANWLRLT